MKSITQIHVDVSTPKKAKKVAAILKSFPTRVNKVVLHRLTEGAVPYTRYALVGCVGRLQIWDFVKPSCTHEVISPKKLKKILSEISSEKAADSNKDTPKDIHDMIRESFGCPSFSSLKANPVNGATIRRIDFDEAKGIDFMTLERLRKLGDSFDRTETFMTDFAKKMAIKPILIDPEKAKSLLGDLEKPLRTFAAIPFTEFYFSKFTSFQRHLIDPWKNTLFNFPLPPFKNVLSEWLKREEEKATAIKKAKEEESKNQDLRMPKIGDLVKAYDEINRGMVVDFEGVRSIEDKESIVGILTDIVHGSEPMFRVNDGYYWNYAETITLAEAQEIYGIKKSN